MHPERQEGQGRARHLPRHEADRGGQAHLRRFRPHEGPAGHLQDRGSARAAGVSGAPKHGQPVPKGVGQPTRQHSRETL